MTATLGLYDIKIQGEVPAGSTITAISFSSDGKFVAVADENGLVTIRRTRGRWAVLRTYRAGKNIRGLVWHPTRLYVLFVGTGAGHLYTIPISQGNDVTRCRKVQGFIHSIAVGNNGSNLALGYCDYDRAVVCLVEEPTRDLERPIILLREGQDTPHQVKYVGPDRLLVAYFERPQFLLIDLNPPHSTIWSMEPPTGSYIGGICLSPSLDHMAVTNLTTGIDFYDIRRGKFVTTAPFNPLAPTGCNRLVGVVYVNEDIVVAGHTNGDVVGLLTNDLEAPYMIKTNNTRNTALPCLRIAHGTADGIPIIAVSRGEGRDARLVIAQLSPVGMRNSTVFEERMHHPLPRHRPSNSQNQARRKKVTPKRAILTMVMVLVLLAVGGSFFLQQVSGFFSTQPMRIFEDVYAATSAFMNGVMVKSPHRFANPYPAPPLGQSLPQDSSPAGRSFHSNPVGHSPPPDIVGAATSPTPTLGIAAFEDKTLILGDDQSYPATVVVCTSTTTHIATVTVTETIITTVTQKATAVPTPVADYDGRPSIVESIFSAVGAILLAMAHILSAIFRLILLTVSSLLSSFGILCILSLVCLILYFQPSDKGGPGPAFKDFLAALFAWGFQNAGGYRRGPRPIRVDRPFSMIQTETVDNRGLSFAGESTAQGTNIHGLSSGAQLAPQRSGSLTHTLPNYYRSSHTSLRPVFQQDMGSSPKETISNLPTHRPSRPSHQPVTVPGQQASEMSTRQTPTPRPPYQSRQPGSQSVQQGLRSFTKETADDLPRACPSLSDIPEGPSDIPEGPSDIPEGASDIPEGLSDISEESPAGVEDGELDADFEEVAELDLETLADDNDDNAPPASSHDQEMDEEKSY